MYTAIVFLPLLGFLIAGFVGNRIGARATEIVTTGLLFVSALLSWVVFSQIALGHGHAVTPVVANWITSGGLKVDWALRIDALTAVMLVVVTSVSSLVHLYSIGYMHEDPSRPRFFGYLSLFTFAMLMLVTADNLVQMFFGWEGVGLASYLLIGFWYEKPSACAAAIKAFVVNRVGDFGFALGIFLVFVLTGSVAFDAIFAAAPGLAHKNIEVFGYTWDAWTITCLLLFMGAMGKSAQFLLHTWLPDAMEGPTPVSALIHAATMVTAGVFMVARLSPLFELSHTALAFVTVIGATTAIFAATVGLVQNDIKRVIAYSTCSQLGYMFVALGIGAYGAAIFHLFTHAFFKALLFLGAGSVIHAMHHEQDMRNMGGLRTKIPVTYWMMMIGTLALTGVGIPGTQIGFAGFFSKDAIIETAWSVGGNLGIFGFWSLTIAALFTSFYSWRLVHLTFHGEARWGHAHAHGHDDHAAHGHDDHGHGAHEPHESPRVMLVPLYVLAAGAVLAGVVFTWNFFASHEGVEHFFGHSLVVNAERYEAAHSVPWLVSWAATIAMLIGFGTAWYMYMVDKEAPKRLAASNPGLYKFLLNKWYFDELYDLLFVKPAFWIGRGLWKGFDDWLVDQTIVEGLGHRVKDVTARVVKLQSGYLYHYAFVMLIGIALLLAWIIASGGLM